MRALAVLALASALAPSIAHAHLGSTKFVRVHAASGGARVVADVDPIDVGYELDLDDPEMAAEAMVAAHGGAIRTWAARAFVVRSAGGACTARASDPEVVATEGSTRMRDAIRIAIEHTCPAPRTDLVLRDGAVFDGDPQHQAIVSLGARATILRAGRQELAIGDAPSALATARTFVVEGALHLVTGYDHLLFLLSLLLTSGAAAAAHGARRTFRDVALVVTGFTLGHSVTLIAAALDAVALPSRLVESAIAGSIILVAAWNLARPDARGALPWIAVVFGLIHGFGFSSVLRELVLPAGERTIALLAFNAGIELAQLAIVALAIGPLAWAGRQLWYRRAVIQGGSIVVASIALVWLVERALLA